MKKRHHRHRHEKAIHVVCLSSGGGPSEDNVAGFLVRAVAEDWGKGSVLAVDAGCHLAAITRLLEPHFPKISQRAASPSTCSSCSSSPEPQHLTSGPFTGLSLPFQSARANALHIVRECVSTYLITHPHLDHLSAFAVNTAAFHNTSRPKTLAALPNTVNAIKTHIFNDVIWPNLTDEDGGVGFVTFQRLASGGNVALGEGSRRGFMEVCNGLTVKGLPISHGHCRKEKEVVDSTAYFIRADDSKREILFFGDVEPDSISLRPRTRAVWEEAAPKIAAGSLKAIFIECSYDDSQGDSVLFGHLAPRHLIAELEVLASMIRPRSEEYPAKRVARLPLAELSVIIIHVKDTLQDGPLINEKILEELQNHEQRLKENGIALGCEFIMSEAGGSYWF